MPSFCRSNRVGPVGLPPEVHPCRRGRRWQSLQPSRWSTIYPPPPPPYRVESAADAVSILPWYPSRHSFVLGLFLLIVGALAIIFNGAALAMSEQWASAGHGFWGGIAFMITGLLGITSAVTKSKHSIVSYMVMSILSALLTFGVLSVGVAGTLCRPTFSTEASSACRETSNDWTSTRDRLFSVDHKPKCPSDVTCRGIDLALEACLVVVAAVAGIVSVWGSVICWRAICSSTVSTCVDVNHNQPPQPPSTALCEQRNSVADEPFFIRTQLLPSASYRSATICLPTDQYWNHPFCVYTPDTTSLQPAYAPPAYTDIDFSKH